VQVNLSANQANPVNGVTVHPVLGAARFRVVELWDSPDAAVGQTLDVMRERVLEDSRDPWFVARAERLGLRGADQTDTCRRVWGHAATGIRFQNDPKTGMGIGGYTEDDVVEVIVRPVDMARYVDMGAAVGDCDDFSMYVAALLRALGVDCRFVTVAADGRDPDQYSHVYGVAYPVVDGVPVRMPLDASHGKYAGWETGNLGRIREWGIGEFGLFDFLLFGAAAYAAVALWNGK
jgi:hypothetical protein